MDDDSRDLQWNALNYRTAHTLHAQQMFEELEKCVERIVAAAVADERQAALDAVNSRIQDGPLQGDGWDRHAERNGLIRAANVLAVRQKGTG